MHVDYEYLYECRAMCGSIYSNDKLHVGIGFWGLTNMDASSTNYVSWYQWES